MTIAKTDADGNPIPQTDELNPDGTPKVQEDKSLSRKEKTAAKLGLTVEEFDALRASPDGDSRISKLEKQNEQILQALQPTIDKQNAANLEAEFNEMGLENVTFADYQVRLTELLELGADPVKAKAKLAEQFKVEGENNADGLRSKGRVNASLPPRTDTTQAPTMTILSKEQYGNLLSSKGVVAYNAYNEYCEKHNEGKYWQ